MFYYEKDGRIRAMKQEHDNIFGQIYLSFYDADKEELSKRFRNRFILGSTILVLILAVPIVFWGFNFGTIVLGVILYALIAFFSALDDIPTFSLFFKDEAMEKFEISTKSVKVGNASSDIFVQSRIIAENGTAGFWEKFLDNKNEAITQEAIELAIQEATLNEAIKGMNDYIRATSESAIRDEVFHKLDEAQDKGVALAQRFNDFEDKLLRAADAERDGKVLQYMEMVDQLGSQAA